jgi:hypothetical protein
MSMMVVVMAVNEDTDESDDCNESGHDDEDHCAQQPD